MWLAARAGDRDRSLEILDADAQVRELKRQQDFFLDAGGLRTAGEELPGGLGREPLARDLVTALGEALQAREERAGLGAARLDPIGERIEPAVLDVDRTLLVAFPR